MTATTQEETVPIARNVEIPHRTRRVPDSGLFSFRSGGVQCPVRYFEVPQLHLYRDWLIYLRPCQHDNGYMDGRSPIIVHTDERT